MSWDDYDLQEFIKENLGHGENERERKIREYLEKKEWRGKATGQTPDQDQYSGSERCSICQCLSAERFLDLHRVCRRCRKPQEWEEDLEKRLKTYFWFLKEIKRLRECAAKFENETPELKEFLKRIK